MRAAVSGQPVTGETEKLRRLGTVMEKATRKALAAALLDEFREADARACRDIGVTRERGATMMARLWGRTFTEERDGQGRAGRQCPTAGPDFTCSENRTSEGKVRIMATIKPYQTGAGATLYMVRYRKPDDRQTMKRGFVTKRAATLFAAIVEVSKAKGEYVAPTLGRVSVGELAPNWLTRKRRATAPSHYRMLDSAWRVHVQPIWGTVPVADVDLLAVEEWITGMVDNGASATTVLRAYGVLSGILVDAVKGKRLAANPTKGVEIAPQDGATSRLPIG